jgi:hypothetical protein
LYALWIKLKLGQDIYRYMIVLPFYRVDDPHVAQAMY